MSDDLCQLIAEAIGAPGWFVNREEGGQELIVSWQARAVEKRLNSLTEFGPNGEGLAAAVDRYRRLKEADDRIAELTARNTVLEKLLAVAVSDVPQAVAS